ncbi:hypothetical protein CFOL_v3_34821 [Cephalotus follicularis]|uniref:Uncharacterized protein n=1 Tax=Cephalotus follicularis TaxID=3775 RepID=A0A1Q3DFW7_CEPFO|nr:hypothetical protein CFOL_v3_34821 [Cephalotus follicularis]
MKRVFLDNGNSANILSLDAFTLMRLPREELKPIQSPLVGFTGDTLRPEGVISLPMMMGENPYQTTIMIAFLVVKMPPTYNVILCRPSHAILKAVTSIPHIKMKFTTLGEVGKARGNQSTTRECYFTSLKSPRKVLPIETETCEENPENRGRPAEELEEILKGGEGSGKSINIGTNLEIQIREQLVLFLKMNLDIFSWFARDTPGIDPETMVHKLSILPNSHPVRQKKRYFSR